MSCKYNILLIILLVVVTFPASLRAQSSRLIPPDSLDEYFRFDEPSQLEFLTALFPPIFIQSGLELKSFLRSSVFLQLRKLYGDRKAVDAIFVKAMKLTKNNTGISLLLSALCTFDHEVVGIKNPLLLLYFPLTGESRDDFFARVRNLPSRLYDDSPKNRTGDRDKLQHFFGSAFLSFTFESRQSAEQFGTMVEEGEDMLIVDGALDERDQRANHQGQEFGLALLENNHRLPSDFIAFHLVNNDAVSAVNRDSTTQSNCSGAW